MKYFLFFSIFNYFLYNIFGYSNSYYDIINAISEGKNLYEILEISPQSDINEIKKNFRKLSLKYHPDKNKNSTSKYLDLLFAKEILTDENKRKEYDNLLKFGIPITHHYYSQYAYKYGAPNVDVKYVFIGLISFITIFHYFYRWQRYLIAKEKIKKTLIYKTKLQQQKGNEPEIIIIGAEKPKFQDLFIITLLLIPFKILKYLYYSIKKSKISLEEYEEKLRLQSGMSQEEWELYKERLEEKKYSSKAKRLRRIMKKMV